MNRHYWRVGCDRIKHLVVDSEIRRLEVHPKLCLIYRECSHPATVVTRERLLEGITKWNSTLTGNKALLRSSLIQLYHLHWDLTHSTSSSTPTATDVWKPSQPCPKCGHTLSPSTSCGNLGGLLPYIFDRAVRPWAVKEKIVVPVFWLHIGTLL